MSSHILLVNICLHQIYRLFSVNTRLFLSKCTGSFQQTCRLYSSKMNVVMCTSCQYLFAPNIQALCSKSTVLFQQIHGLFSANIQALFIKNESHHTYLVSMSFSKNEHRHMYSVSISVCTKYIEALFSPNFNQKHGCFQQIHGLSSHICRLYSSNMNVTTRISRLYLSSPNIQALFSKYMGSWDQRCGLIGANIQALLVKNDCHHAYFFSISLFTKYIGSFQ